MARYALAQGDKVVATLRKPNALASFASKYPSSQLLLIKLDVTNQQEIRDVFHKAKDAFGRVDVVFNNAGIVIAGEAEATPEESARKMFETNFWGAAHVSLEAIRFFRDENEPQGGRLIQTSAAAGFVGLPMLGFNAASKHGGVGGTHGGSDQGVAWNIKITTVEPGIFTTALETNAEFLPQHPAYTDDSSPTSIARKMLAELRSNGGVVKKSPVKFAQRIFELSELPNPPARLPLGHDCIAMLKGQVAKLTKATEEYASWSDDLGFEDVTSYAAG
ncbi:NAD(P)-binding protein [Lentinus tigrinus ALCF2SS1-7]|nr:NAD(P)-binding protein [Lentinus tigrinus ALCF2SS1-7]